LINEKTGKSKTIPQNFTICLLNKDGKIVRYFKPSEDLDELKKSIKRILAQERLSQRALTTMRSIKSVKSIS
jgi:glutathione peroxidase-family protein